MTIAVKARWERKLVLDQEALESALRHLERIRELSIRNLAANQDAGLKLPAESLKECDVSFKSWFGYTEDGDKLFAGRAPKLNHLSLRNCSLDWVTSICVNLIHLFIIVDSRMYSLPLDRVITQLSKMPRLEELTLSHPFLYNADYSYPEVGLPRLKKFTINTQLDICVQLMTSIVHRGLSYANVACYPAFGLSGYEDVSDGLLQNMDSFSRLVAKQLSREDAHGIHSVDMTNHLSNIKIRASKTSGPEGPFELEVTHRSYGPTASEALLERVLYELSAGSLEYLRISSFKRVLLSEQAWLNIARLNDLKQLTIEGNDVPGFLKAFYGTNRPANGSCFHNLETLSVKLCHHPSSGYHDNAGRVIIDDLKKCASQRREKKMPLALIFWIRILYAK
ncbi:hypothetical protein H0H87_005348 [Tephrocybe sp. NHM501043]|nr:hypothetical protein H0H87_005348 [Tephrocybe sp. NHM501043]